MSKLSEDFPGYKALIEAGYTTEAKVNNASDEELLAVPGIGQATLDKIREALGGNTQSEAANEASEPASDEATPFQCAAPLCGHRIASYPCPYCGHTAE